MAEKPDNAANPKTNKDGAIQPGKHAPSNPHNDPPASNPNGAPKADGPAAPAPVTP